MFHQVSQQQQQNQPSYDHLLFSSTPNINNIPSIVHNHNSPHVFFSSSDTSTSTTTTTTMLMPYEASQIQQQQQPQQPHPFVGHHHDPCLMSVIDNSNNTNVNNNNNNCGVSRSHYSPSVATEPATMNHSYAHSLLSEEQQRQQQAIMMHNAVFSGKIPFREVAPCRILTPINLFKADEKEEEEEVAMMSPLVHPLTPSSVFRLPQHILMIGSDDSDDDNEDNENVLMLISPKTPQLPNFDFVSVSNSSNSFSTPTPSTTLCPSFFQLHINTGHTTNDSNQGTTSVQAVMMSQQEQHQQTATKIMNPGSPLFPSIDMSVIDTPTPSSSSLLNNNNNNSTFTSTAVGDATSTTDNKEGKSSSSLTIQTNQQHNRFNMLFDRLSSLSTSSSSSSFSLLTTPTSVSTRLGLSDQIFDIGSSSSSSVSCRTPSTADTRPFFEYDADEFVLNGQVTSTVSTSAVAPSFGWNNQQQQQQQSFLGQITSAPVSNTAVVNSNHQQVLFPRQQQRQVVLNGSVPTQKEEVNNIHVAKVRKEPLINSPPTTPASSTSPSIGRRMSINRQMLRCSMSTSTAPTTTTAASASISNMDDDHPKENDDPSPNRRPSVGSSSDPLASPQKSRYLSAEVKEILKNWYTEHVANPYPTDEEKRELLQRTGISRKTLDNWFVNTRIRSKPKIISKQSKTSSPNRGKKGSGK